MSHDIESDYKEDYWDEEKCCPHCNSCEKRGAGFYCKEFEEIVPATAHCDFFASRD